MIKRIAAALLVTFTSFSAMAYSNLEELMTDMNRKQVEAIRAYIEANPEASDLADANERLIYGLISVDDYDGALALLNKSYKQLPEDKTGLDLSVAFGQVVVPIIQIYKMQGRKDDATAFIAEVRKNFKNHEMYETITQTLDEFTKMFDLPGVGDSLDISFTAVDGREVNLADLKGKIVLVDFWATWCAPCLKSMPGVKSLYAKYHDQGFEVIGISLDDDKDKLEKFLEKEGIAWPQFYDGKGWENKLAMEYGVESIPATFLIGPDGLIAATDASETVIESFINNPELVPAKAADGAKVPAE